MSILHRFCRFRCKSQVIITISAASCLLPLIVLAAGDKPPYLTAPASTVQAEVSSSKKMGEANGDVYYFKAVSKGTGSIFRVSMSGNTKYASVGIIFNNKYMITPEEKSGFFAMVTDRPATDFTEDSAAIQIPASPPGGAGAPASAPASPYSIQVFGANSGQILRDGKVVALIGPAPGSPTGETLMSTTGGSVPPDVMKFYESYKRGDGLSGSVAKSSKGPDGKTPTVQFMNDPHFGNDLVEWKGGTINILRDGDKFAELLYAGGGYHENGAKRGFMIAQNEVIGALTHGRSADIYHLGWQITTPKGVFNTEVYKNGGNRRGAGIVQRNPFGLGGEVIAATDVYRQQIDQSFTYPGLDKLREDSVGASSQQPDTTH